MAAPLPSYFVNVESGALVRVVEVDTSYASIETLAPQPASYSMPVAQYDSQFAKLYRPATAADLRALTPKQFRLPANAPASWTA